MKLLNRTLVICLILTLLTGCTKEPDVPTDPITKSTFLLNTVVTITLYDSSDETIIDKAFELCSQYESIFSRTLPESELYQLNQGLLPHDDNGYTVSKDLYRLIEKGLEYGDLSDGNFDIAIEPVSSLWDFHAANPVLPNKADIEKALPYINYKNISLNGGKVAFDADTMGFDLGAIAKGYIADRLKEFLLEQGVESAMINLGGNVLCVGNKPDGSAFKIGIQKPFADRNETVAVMELKDVSVVSSGIYERYFTVDGKEYHHILNPKTGYPYESDLVSVTIISKDSVDGDGLSTSCFSLGLEKGLELINSLNDTHAVFITNDYELHFSDGFHKAIPITE